MAKAHVQADVLVLGQHPAAYLAALLLRDKPALQVVHSTIPTEHNPDRLTIINPQFFKLHPALGKIRKKLKLTGIWGLHFLSDDPETAGEYRDRSSVGCVGSFDEVKDACAELAKEAGAKLSTPRSLSISRVDEKGLEVLIDDRPVHAKLLLLAGLLPQNDARRLGLPEPWAPEQVRRYVYLRLKGAQWAHLGGKPTVPMSLDLDGQLTWAWMLPGENEVQIAVEQVAGGGKSAETLLNAWVKALRGHGLVTNGQPLPIEQAESIEIPAAGALSREGVANRTLLFGPAGGFYTACLEDIYSNGWSAVFAVQSGREALKEIHLQDALRSYRESWGTTLGEYLRGPQQNLRFLLPLVYRNPVMTARLGESILLGKSVVR